MVVVVVGWSSSNGGVFGAAACHSRVRSEGDIEDERVGGSRESRGEKVVHHCL